MFQLLRRESVAGFGLTFHEYRHESGARHLHLHMPGDLHAFDLSFRTLPADESGVAHILEHCVLEGSRRFPVPGMFHKRSSSSFSAFSNAMTGRDQTSYLFHTPLPKDFDQLLEMYLDACFFPLLAGETFRQEGHRLEPVDLDDPASPLQLTGVVYNEMKAHYANPVQRALRVVMDSLLPGTPYALDSGGNPSVIPTLSHEAFLDFHRRHYCPANAAFLYAGPLAPEELQERLERLVLTPLAGAHGEAAPLPQWLQPPAAAQTRRAAFPFSGQGRERMGLGLLAWRLGRQPGLADELVAQVLTQWLAGSSEAPLIKLILESGMGGPLVSLVPIAQEPLLLAGAQGMELDKMDAHLDRLQAELERLGDTPPDPALLRAIVDQMELENRGTEDEDAGPGAFPMQLLDRLREALRLGADPLERLNPAAVLEELRPRLTDPAFLCGELRTRMLERGGLRLMMEPDSELGAREAAVEQAWLAERTASLGEADRRRLAREARELQVHREDHSRDHLVPRLHLADVERTLPWEELERRWVEGLDLRVQRTPANGLVHLDLAAELLLGSAAEVASAHWLGYVSEFGYGRLDHEQADLRRRELGAPLAADHRLVSRADEAGPLRAELRLSGHCTAERAEEYAEMMLQTLEQARLDDVARWGQFLHSTAASWRRAAAGAQVHTHLSRALGAPHSAKAHLSNELRGFPGLRALNRRLAGQEIPALVDDVRLWQTQVAEGPRSALLASDPQVADRLGATLEAAWRRTPAPVESVPVTDTGARVPQAWLTDTTVSYVGLSWKGPARAHEDWPLLRVACQLLTSRYLHPRIREQGGAYGAFAQVHSGHLELSTYRDPRLAESFEDLRGAWNWLLAADMEARHVEEAALAALKGLLLAQSPVARVRLQLEREQSGVDRALLERDVALLRAVDLDAVRAAVRRAIDPATEVAAVVCSREALRASGLKGFVEEEI